MTATTDGESHDVASLDLSGVQEDLVQAVFETGTPTVVVLINGRPLSTRWTSEHVPALVEAWEPGERGGRSRGRRPLRELQSHRPPGHHRPPPLRPIAGLLQLQAIQGRPDGRRATSICRRRPFTPSVMV